MTDTQSEDPAHAPGPKYEYSFMSGALPYRFLLTPINPRTSIWIVRVVGVDAAAPYSSDYRWPDAPPKNEHEAIGMACERILVHFPNASGKTQTRLR
jgi:hypothetical protein